MNDVLKDKIKELIKFSFCDGVSETLVTLLTNDHPSQRNMKWEEFEENEWKVAEGYLFEKLDKIIKDVDI